MKRGVLMSAALAAAAGLLAGSATRAQGFDRSASDRTAVKVSFVSFPVSAGGKTWQTAGELREPQQSGALPAVLIVHGSGGVDSRGETYARALNKAGIATLEIDLWSVRGVAKPEDRPKAVAETLPDAFGALHFLSHRSGIDPKRIGIMGFSWGGVVSMLSATRESRDAFATPGEAFAAHAPFYPVCWVYNHVPGYGFTDLTGAPVLIQAGAKDLYDTPHSCLDLWASLPEATRKLVSVTVYPQAGHAWDRREPDTVITDPFSHEGKGGQVPFRWNADVTRRSTGSVVAFFQAMPARP